MSHPAPRPNSNTEPTMLHAWEPHMTNPPSHELPYPASSGARVPRSGAVAPLLPAWLIIALHRAHEAERTATGDSRIPAFRLTRSLLGGARHAGYTPARLAEGLGISVGSVRNRGSSDGWIAADVFAELTDLSPDTVDSWIADGMLPSRATDEAGRDCYLASELIYALTRQIRSPR
ncbi:MAG: hypothetical protein JWO57_3526 [Pseudonocardiales bacterium]|nr:hypothetical protein [Pseudonocardiales bacterium]